MSLMSISSMKHLRASAISNSLFTPTTLRVAIHKLGFVQADPIRSPATAQDLILRPRVNGYRAGDLEKKYPSLNIEEDYVYAYGFMPRSTWQLLHPRDMSDLPPLEQTVLELVRKSTRIHPADLEQHLGRERVVNAWGGYSKATTRALDHLHHRGLLRIAAREKGIRIYEAAPVMLLTEIRTPPERLKDLVLLLANIFAPSPRKSLQETVNKLRYSFAPADGLRTVLDVLIKSGELLTENIDGVPYVYPATFKTKKEVVQEVRILAPFDPVVWDRMRFEHLWGLVVQVRGLHAAS